MVPLVLWEYGVDDPDDPTWVRTDISWSTNPDDWEAARAELADIIEGIPPASRCVQDVNQNGVGDIVDIQATAAQPGCWVYLPVVVANWRQPWPTPTMEVRRSRVP